MTVDELAKRVREVNAANGWEQPTTQDWQPTGNKYLVPAKLALVHSEVSEALEAYRNANLPNYVEELADTVIRVLELAGGVTVNFESMILAKIEHNAKRGFRHGGKIV